MNKLKELGFYIDQNDNFLIRWQREIKEIKSAKVYEVLEIWKQSGSGIYDDHLFDYYAYNETQSTSVAIGLTKDVFLAIQEELLRLKLI